MPLFSDTGNLDQAIAELDEAFGNIARKAQIESIQRRIAKREREHKGTALLRNELCRLMTRQIEYEVSAS